MLDNRAFPSPALPLLSPLGDSGLLVRFGASLSEDANRAAISFSDRLRATAVSGVEEVAGNLVSVLIRYDAQKTSYDALAGEVRLLLAGADKLEPASSCGVAVAVDFGGEGGPDLAEVAAILGLSQDDFIKRHNAVPLRVLATGFAPGFVYCGFHPESLRVSRRPTVRARVPAGTVLFAAGQTAITSTAIPTGWHVIGHTRFANFSISWDPPTQLRPGDLVRFRSEFV